MSVELTTSAASPVLSDALRVEYTSLFDTLAIRPERLVAANRSAGKVSEHETRYRAVSEATNVPWFVVGLVHLMEADLSFDRHLHNGDPLTARTVHVPKHRPVSGTPPFTWEESAIDAMRFDGFDQWHDWSVAGVLYKLEAYNGWGYRLHHPGVRTPYLWSFSTHYSKGKYVGDGVWSATAVSAQCGSAVVLHILVADHKVQIPAGQTGPLLTWSGGAVAVHGEALQHFLNGLPGISLVEDGKLGPATSDALKRATGHRLHGDPRA